MVNRLRDRTTMSVGVMKRISYLLQGSSSFISCFFRGVGGGIPRLDQVPSRQSCVALLTCNSGSWPLDYRLLRSQSVNSLA